MITYQPLLKKLEKKKMTLRDLMLETGIAPNTMTKIRRNETVSLEVLEKFCQVLKCDFRDVIKYVEKEEQESTREYVDR